MGGEEERVVEAGDADDDADRPARPEPDQALAGREQVERHGLAVQPGDLLGGGGECQECPGHLDPAVHQGLAGFEHEQPLELLPPVAQGVVGGHEGGAAGV
ncbi:hypothetical protein GCM10020220_017500 [Nonomuraea rubra]